MEEEHSMEEGNFIKKERFMQEEHPGNERKGAGWKIKNGWNRV